MDHQGRPSRKQSKGQIRITKLTHSHTLTHTHTHTLSLCLCGQTSLEQERENLKASSDLDIWCEIVPPFNVLPKALLEKTCNAVLRTTLKTLLKSFLKDLSDDYKQWSTDTAYREERAKRSLTKTV